MGETEGVGRQPRLAVKLAYIYSAFVMAVEERLSAGKLDKPSQLLRVAHPLCPSRGTSCSVPGGFGPLLSSFWSLSNYFLGDAVPSE